MNEKKLRNRKKVWKGFENNIKQNEKLWDTFWNSETKLEKIHRVHIWWIYILCHIKHYEAVNWVNYTKFFRLILWNC